MISASVIIADTTDSRFRSSRLWGVAYEVTGARALLRQTLYAGMQYCLVKRGRQRVESVASFAATRFDVQASYHRILDRLSLPLV